MPAFALVFASVWVFSFIVTSKNGNNNAVNKTFLALSFHLYNKLLFCVA